MSADRLSRVIAEAVNFAVAIYNLKMLKILPLRVPRCKLKLINDRP